MSVSAQNIIMRQGEEAKDERESAALEGELAEGERDSIRGDRVVLSFAALDFDQGFAKLHGRLRRLLEIQVELLAQEVVGACSADAATVIMASLPGEEAPLFEVESIQDSVLFPG